MHTEEAPAKKYSGPGIGAYIIGVLGLIGLGLSARIAMIPVMYQGVNYGIVFAVLGFIVGAILVANSVYLISRRRHFLSMHEYAVVGIYGTIVLFLIHAAAVATVLIILSFANQVDF